ncbi:fatty acid desaturase [Myxococcota bacterium]|nr:fatty acid desaturase [Myxococcota bacterium]
MEDVRNGAELIRATRPHSDEDPAKTWTLFAFTVAVAIACLAVIVVAPWPPLAWAASTVLALVNVRFFIFFHDCFHGAIFRGSKLGHALMKAYGLLILCPHRIWRDSHNYHHAHTSKLVGSSIGSFPLLTVRMYRMATPMQRFLYRAARHPLTMVFGYVTVFGLGMCVRPLLEQPKKYWSGALSIAVHVALTAGLVAIGGWSLAVLAYLFPLAVSMAIGSYLFYAQHTFPGMELYERKDWEYTEAALHSTSMMETGTLMGWFTGNIGYHHVHHLNSQIPFYRLPETMAAVPELQKPAVTSLAPRDVLKCLSIHLWDPMSKRMLTWAEAADLGRTGLATATAGSTAGTEPPTRSASS